MPFYSFPFPTFSQEIMWVSCIAMSLLPGSESMITVVRMHICAAILIFLRFANYIDSKDNEEPVPIQSESYYRYHMNRAFIGGMVHSVLQYLIVVNLDLNRWTDYSLFILTNFCYISYLFYHTWNVVDFCYVSLGVIYPIVLFCNFIFAMCITALFSFEHTGVYILMFSGCLIDWFVEKFWFGADTTLGEGRKMKPDLPYFCPEILKSSKVYKGV